MKRFYVIACNILWREISWYAAQSENYFFLNFVKQGLHNTPDIMKMELQEIIDEIDEEYDAILLGYGLCGKGTEGIKARNIPIVMMRGHDCITFLLGSKERYKEYFNTHPGTYWYSSGWIETTLMPGKDRYHKTFDSYKEKFGDETAEFLMQSEQTWLKEYTTAAYIEHGINNDEQYKNYTKECADWLGWKTDFLKGNPDLFKNFLDGKWDKENFLIINPGEKLSGSADDRIIIAEQTE